MAIRCSLRFLSKSSKALALAFLALLLISLLLGGGVFQLGILEYHPIKNNPNNKMVPLVLETSCKSIKNIYTLKPMVWKDFSPRPEDLKQLEFEAQGNSTFDPLKLKATVWDNYKNGNFKMICKESSTVKIIAILPPGKEIPLDLWGRIFQWLGPSSHGTPWKVFWLGSETPRKFPKKGEPLSAKHLNGGYTMPCSTKGIFIYRLEEATRVLIHEILHAACLDPPDASLEVREATVETWAELFLIALKAKGFIKKAEELLQIQLQWVADTNHRALKDHSVTGPEHYGWRYLNGREHVYESLGILLPKAGNREVQESRFTDPVLD